MNKKIMFWVIGVVALVAFGAICSKVYYKTDKVVVIPTENESSGPWFDRIYVGNLPCADCMGIEEKLLISYNDDKGKTGKYELTDVYLTDKPEADTFEAKGTWSTEIVKGEIIFKLINNDETQTAPYYYKQSADFSKMTSVDENGKEFDSELNFTLELQPEVAEVPVGIANPASTNCLIKGGTLEIKENGAGQYGLCYFEDNKACEEWALMREECPEGGMKITGYDTEEQRYCAWLGGHTTTNEGAVCTFDDDSTCALDKLFNGECKRGEIKG